MAARKKPTKTKPTKRKPEEHIDRLADVRDRGALTDDDDQALAEGLATGHFRVVAFVARILRELAGPERWRRHAPALVEAFLALVGDAKATGHKKDPGCRAKLAIAEGLADAMLPEEELFLTGLTLRQLEPSFGAPGGHEDSAGGVRAACLLGLAHMSHPDVSLHAADLLVDPERTAREGAAVALGVSGRLDARPVLRLKALTGDKDPEVTHAVLLAILGLTAEDLPFVAGLLDDDDPVLADAAAQALADSHLPGAFPPLRRALAAAVTPVRKRQLVTALAALRVDEAQRFVRGLREGDDATLAALARELALQPLADQEAGSP